MGVLYALDEHFSAHDPGAHHPESALRLEAVRKGIESAGLAEALVTFAPRRATRAELLRVHDERYLGLLEGLCLRGGGAIDADTVVVAASFEAALRAAGAGLEAIERLRAGEAEAAFLAVRPPGHHARRGTAMGFCLINHVAVAAAALVEAGERVLILDWDAHHGNGTQELFWTSPEVLYVSLHQWPFYPGTGAVGEIGSGAGLGATINLPLPEGSSGESYRRAIDEVVLPAAERFSPTWLVVSAGFDAHRDDPLTDLGLSAGDFADLTGRLQRLVVAGRRLFFLEGGYDLRALARSAAATVATLAGAQLSTEAPSSSERPGADDAAAELTRAAGLLHERCFNT